MSTEPPQPHHRLTLQNHPVPQPGEYATDQGTPTQANTNQPGTPQPSTFRPNTAQPQIAPAHHMLPHPTPEPPTIERALPYHRLALADARSRWFSPILEGLLGAVIYFMVAIAFAVVVIIVLFVRLPNNAALEFNTDLLQSQVLDDPLLLVYLFGSITLMIPALYLARLACGPKPWSLVHSVHSRIRWPILWVGLGCAAICYGTYYVVLLGADGFASLGFHHHQPQQVVFWVYILLILTLVPVQCYAEELVFRGYLMQTIGRWLKHPAWAIALPAPLFMLGHTYDLWGQLSVLMMGMVSGFLCWYTGGLEVSIGLHVVNNVLSMMLGYFAGADPFQQQGSNPLDFAAGSTIEVLYAALICWYVRRKGFPRTGTFHVKQAAPHRGRIHTQQPGTR